MTRPPVHTMATRRLVTMLAGGFLTLVGLIVALAAYNGWWSAIASTGPLAGLSGVTLAAGGALLGIGMGRWERPRPPHSEADYTGPGTLEDESVEPPRVV